MSVSTTKKSSKAPTLIERITRFEADLWERVDRVLLRLQGRLDTPGYDRGLPYVVFLVLAFVLITISLARFNSLNHGLETAKYVQATWQIGEGYRPETTLAAGNLIASQGSIIIYPLALLTSWFPRAQCLIVLQSVSLAASVIPLWRLARDPKHGRLGISSAILVVFSYCTYSALHAMNAADFSPAIMATPLLMSAAYTGFTNRNVWLFIYATLAMCCRADLAIALFGFGILLAFTRNRKVGLALSSLSLLWFVISIYGLQRTLADGEFNFLSAYSSFGDTPMAILAGIVTQPMGFLRTVFTLSNFKTVVTLLAPVLFLPLTAPRFLMPAVPLYVLYLGADVTVGRISEAAQTVPMTVFVFVATVFALQRTGRILVQRVRVDRRVLLAMLLTASVFFVRDSVTSPYERPWQWGVLDAADEKRTEVAAELSAIDDPVRASWTLLPPLAERLALYPLELGGEGDLNVIVEEVTKDVDWVVIDRNVEYFEDFSVFRVRMIAKGWEYQRDDETGIDIFRFTGIISSGDEIVLGDAEGATSGAIETSEPVDTTDN